LPPGELARAPSAPGASAEHTARTAATRSGHALRPRGRPQALMLLCEFVLNSTRAPPREEALYHTLLQLYLAERLVDEPDAAAAAAAQPGRRCACPVAEHATPRHPVEGLWPHALRSSREWLLLQHCRLPSSVPAAVCGQAR
jgi:hypothetical protein